MTRAGRGPRGRASGRARVRWALTVRPGHRALRRCGPLTASPGRVGACGCPMGSVRAGARRAALYGTAVAGAAAATPATGSVPSGPAAPRSWGAPPLPQRPIARGASRERSAACGEPRRLPLGGDFGLRTAPTSAVVQGGMAGPAGVVRWPPGCAGPPDRAGFVVGTRPCRGRAPLKACAGGGGGAAGRCVRGALVRPGDAARVGRRGGFVDGAWWRSPGRWLGRRLTASGALRRAPAAAWAGAGVRSAAASGPRTAPPQAASRGPGPAPAGTPGGRGRARCSVNPHRACEYA